MQKIIYLFSLFLILAIQLKGQKGNDFNILIPDIKVGDSKYNNLRYIESRPDPDDMGFVYGGIWNGPYPVESPISIESQLQSLVSAVSFPSDERKTLAVQMRVLFFSMGEQAREGKGLCNLRMTLYEMDEKEEYYFLNTIDTLLIDDRKKIKTSAEETISGFIIANLPYYAEDGEIALSMKDILDIDFYEKNSIPLYIEESLPNGIYTSYKSLKNLKPDISSDITAVKTKEGEIKEIKIPNIKKRGKYRKLKPGEMYAIVIDNALYVSFDGNLYKAYKKDDDWRFIITQKIAGSGFSLDISVASGNSRGGGVVGFGIPLGGKTENVEMFIDHLNGDFFWGGKMQE